MKPRYDTPLTDEEQAFAAEHYPLIVTFLSKSKLSFDEWYDVAALAYLRAVKTWFANPDAKKWAFSSVAFNSMKASIGWEKLKQARIQTVSLEEPISNDGELTIGDTICDIHANDFAFTFEDEDETKNEQETETGIKRKDILTKDIIRLYQKGMNITQIAKLYSASQHTISNRLIKANVPLRHDKAEGRFRKDVSVEKVTNMYHDGISPTRIAIMLKCSRKLVYVRLHNGGVKFNSKSQYGGFYATSLY